MSNEAGAAKDVGAASAGPARDPNGKFTDEEIWEAFTAFDLDKNNFVGAAEIRHVLINIGEQVTDEEVDEMIRMIDSDGDGQVSRSELLSFMARRGIEINVIAPLITNFFMVTYAITNYACFAAEHTNSPVAQYLEAPQTVSRGGGANLSQTLFLVQKVSDTLSPAFNSLKTWTLGCGGW